MPGKNLLQKVGNALSNQKYITRYHATGNRQNIPSVLNTEGVRPSSSPGFMPVVYTTAGKGTRGFFTPDGERDALIEYQIPKKWYLENVVRNPKYDDHRIEKQTSDIPMLNEAFYEGNSMARQVTPVYNGGRADTFGATIPNEFIRRICFGENAEKCYDPKVLKNFTVNDAPLNTPSRVGLWEWGYDIDPTYDDFFEEYGLKPKGGYDGIR